MAEIIREMDVFRRRGEHVETAALRLLKAANQLGLDGYRILRLSDKSYRSTDETMDVVIEDVRDPHAPARDILPWSQGGNAVTCQKCGNTSFVAPCRRFTPDPL